MKRATSKAASAAGGCGGRSARPEAPSRLQQGKAAAAIAAGARQGARPAAAARTREGWGKPSRGRKASGVAAGCRAWECSAALTAGKRACPHMAWTGARPASSAAGCSSKAVDPHRYHPAANGGVIHAVDCYVCCFLVGEPHDAKAPRAASAVKHNVCTLYFTARGEGIL